MITCVCGHRVSEHETDAGPGPCLGKSCSCLGYRSSKGTKPQAKAEKCNEFARFFPNKVAVCKTKMTDDECPNERMHIIRKASDD